MGDKEVLNSVAEAYSVIGKFTSQVPISEFIDAAPSNIT